MSTDPFLEYTIYAFRIILALIGLHLAVKKFRDKISWGAARRMGVTKEKFFWMNIIYFLVLLDGVCGLVSFILDWSFWVEILLFVVILMLALGLYLSLRRREKFWSELFWTLFLVPVIFPGIHIVGKIIFRISHIAR